MAVVVFGLFMVSVDVFSWQPKPDNEKTTTTAKRSAASNKRKVRRFALLLLSGPLAGLGVARAYGWHFPFIKD
jgi:hypothetical protein